MTFVSNWNSIPPTIPPQLGTINLTNPINGLILSGSLLAPNGGNANYSFEISETFISGSNNYSVYGKSTQNTGDGIYLYKMNNLYGGMMEIGGQKYFIFPKNGDTVLVINNQPDGDIQFTQDDVANYRFDDDGSICGYASGCGETIDVLVILNQASLDEMQLWTTGSNPYAATIVLLCLTEWATNYSFYLSQINAFVKITFINFNFNTTSNIKADIANFVLDQNVHSLRYSNHSDVVILLAAQKYSGVAGIVNEVAPDYKTPYGIVDLKWLPASPGTFIHELGHLLGARHDRPHDTDPGCHHAHGFNPCGMVNMGAIKTVMGVQVVGVERLFHFSNPNVLFKYCLGGTNNQYTGTVLSNNSGIVNETSCQVSKFDVYNIVKPQLSRTYTNVCVQDQTFNLCLNSLDPPENPMQDPIDYLWYWSVEPRIPIINPFNYLIDITSSPCFDIPISDIHADNFFIICQMWDSANKTLETVSSKRINKDNACTGHTWELKKGIYGIEAVDKVGYNVIGDINKEEIMTIFDLKEM